MIVVFPDHTHLLFEVNLILYENSKTISGGIHASQCTLSSFFNFIDNVVEGSQV